MELNAIIAIAQILATLAICATLGIYYRQMKIMESQLNAMEQSAQSVALLDVIKWISESEIRAARKTLMMTRGKRLEAWSEDEKAKAKKVCVYYDIVGILIKNRVVPEDIIESHWGQSIIQCREAAAGLIDQTRKEINSEAWGEYDRLCLKATELAKGKKNS